MTSNIVSYFVIGVSSFLLGYFGLHWLFTKLGEISSGRETNKLTADGVEWVVNDFAELGVRIAGQCFFLYKGYFIVYDDPDDGPRYVRVVGKREFGETCFPEKMVREGRLTNYDITNPEHGLVTGPGSGGPSGMPLLNGGWEPLIND